MIVYMKKYIAIPEGIYSLQIDDFEERTSKDRGQPYLLWKISITEGAMQGKRFSVITAKDLTLKNNLARFLLRIGLEAMKPGMQLDLSQLKGYGFVGKVVVEKNKTGGEFNKIGEITVPEYNRLQQQSNS